MSNRRQTVRTLRLTAVYTFTPTQVTLMPSPTNTTRFVLLTLLFVLACNFTSSLVGWGWPTATIISFAMTLVYTWYVWRHHESLLGRILLFDWRPAERNCWLTAGWWILPQTGRKK